MTKIFDVKHFAVHDGPGIRTTVFLKGCPLKCLWCHNPESISPKSQLSFLASKCVGCGKCADVCEHGVHIFENGHTLRRENCIFCGKCEKVCHADALTIYGKDVTVADIMPEVLEDVDFYGENGGVTISGGECLAQAEFCAELLAEVKKHGIHTVIDTCGFVKKEAIDKVLPYTDLFLYDMKAYDEDVHIRCTGKSNKQILENLVYLDSIGKDVEIRIPFVPGYNDNQIYKIGEFLATLTNIKKVKVLPYHRYAKSKYISLDMDVCLPEKTPEKDEIDQAVEILEGFGLVCKK